MFDLASHAPVRCVRTRQIAVACEVGYLASLKGESCLDSLNSVNACPHEVMSSEAREVPVFGRGNKWSRRAVGMWRLGLGTDETIAEYR